MSDKEAPANSKKDAALLLGWIISLILIAAFCWYIAQPLRNLILQRSVNRVLEQSGDRLRLGEPASPRMPRAGFGSFFEAAALSDNRAVAGELIFVFTVIADGYFFPCAAIIGRDGMVQGLIPLGSHAERMMNRISPGVLRLYTLRIEGAAL